MRRAYYGYTRKEYKKRRRKKKRDWHRSEFNNPYFLKPQQINLKPYLCFLLVSIIITILCYFLLIFDYWQINSITIETKNQIYRDKTQQIIDNALNSKVLKVLSGANYFLFNPKNVKKEIENELLVKNLEIHKKIPNKVIINFQKIEATYVWIQNNKFYNIDEGGMVLDEIISVQHQAPNDDNNIQNGFSLKEIKKFLQNSDANLYLPIIYNANEVELKSRDYIEDKEIFQLINNLNSEMAKQININVILYKIDTKNFKKIEVITEAGWEIYFDPENSLDEQMGNLDSLMQKTFKETQPVEYIDLRYGNKIYYK